MAIDVQALVSPLDGPDPAGAEFGIVMPGAALAESLLEDVKARDVIERGLEEALTSDPARPESRAVDRAKPPTAPEIRKAVEAGLGKSRDLWLARSLTQVGLMEGDLDAVAAGAEIAAGLLGGLWDHVHPKLEDGDATGRVNICNDFGSHRDFGLRLNKLVIWRSRNQGAFRVRELPEPGQAPSPQLSMALKVEGAVGELRLAAAQLRRLRAAVEDIDEQFARQGSRERPTLTVGVNAVSALLAKLALLTGDEAPEVSAEPGVDAEAPMGGEAVVRSGGPIRSRQDVSRALDDIAAFYKANEPGSPIPAALDRVKSWINMSFFDLMRDIAPNSLSDAERVLGKSEDPNR